MPADPLAVVRELVARRVELPLAAVAGRTRLLTDLHRSSIAAGQLVVEAARRLGAPPPASPTDYADASVGEIAASLAGRVGAADPGGAERHPPGVDTWVRCFERVLVERERPRGAALAAGFRVLQAPGDPLAAALSAAAGGAVERVPPGVPAKVDGNASAGIAAEEPSSLLVCLPAWLDPPALDLLVAAGRRAMEHRADRFVLVHRGVGAGFARTLHLERGGGEVVVIEVPAGELGEAARAAVVDAVLAAARAPAGAGGYAEVVIDAAGRARAPVLRLLDAARPEAAPADLPLGPADVLLVTGGGRGIAAEAGFELARASGAALALVGRSRPGESPELAANLERFAAAGVRFAYRAADVTDPAAVRAAAAAAAAELGSVTAVLHGAGVNRPQPITALTADDLAATRAVKVDGLSHVLAAVDAARLRLLVAFGSVIAEAGLPGEADYALANEALARAVERFAAAHPACRCRTIEWSVWSGVGMGERLGTLESLLARGITPIPPDRGLAMLAELVARPDLPPTVVVAGRLGDPPTIDLGRPELPFLRFLERERVHVPGVELVVDCELAAASDPYLDEHVFAGERLFPAVLGLEAMAQAAAALLGRAGAAAVPVFEAVRFERPVAVPADGALTLRLAALARGPGRAEVALRSSDSGFAADCFRATCVFAEAAEGAGAVAGGADGAAASGAVAASAAVRSAAATGVAANGGGDSAPPPLALDPAVDLYGGVLFHRGRFRRLAAYRRLTATECLAEIAGDGNPRWFGRHLPGALLLGDPAARDAAIHAVQACIPHATVLPTGVERLVAGVLAAGAPHRVEARERSRSGRDLVYDLEVRDAAGRLVERWEGLALRAVEEGGGPRRWPVPLLAPYLERRLADLLPAAAARVTLTPGRGEAATRRRPDGRPDPPPDGRTATRSHGAGLTLEVTADGAAGCDVEPVAPRPPEDWRGLLGAGRHRLAALVAAEADEDADTAATRVWAAGEAAKKAGLPVDVPLVLDEVAGGGWVLLRAGGARVATFVAPLAAAAAATAVRLAFAFAWQAAAEAPAAAPPQRAPDRTSTERVA
ncbi:MAG TPA: SDR family NAD(P)-dependent oxidoreductase [Thermoanaerobaculia bacterium]